VHHTLEEITVVGFSLHAATDYCDGVATVRWEGKLSLQILISIMLPVMLLVRCSRESRHENVIVFLSYQKSLLYFTSYFYSYLDLLLFAFIILQCFNTE